MDQFGLQIIIKGYLMNTCEHSIHEKNSNIFDGCSPELKYGSLIIARCLDLGCLTTTYDQIRSRAALGVLRRMLEDNRISNTTWFLLNKQAAFAGVVVVTEDETESPLGPIRVKIVCDELDELIDW